MIFKVNKIKLWSVGHHVIIVGEYYNWEYLTKKNVSTIFLSFLLMLVGFPII